MGQIVKGKKKGRPSKADLARRACQGAPAGADNQTDRRRSLRRRNVRYDSFIDYDDYLDQFEEEEDEEEEGEEKERRNGKKVKLAKLENQKSSKSARGGHARRDGSSSRDEDEEDEREEKPVTKKRKINGGDESDQAEYESENEEEDDKNNSNDEGIIDQEERKVGGGCGGSAKGRPQDSVPGTPSDRPNGSGTPMPDKKSLDLILGKLQKKDTYGVYSEPVDLEELPDYLDVIDHPMDFTTVRKKLADGSYATLEEFQSDVFLICSNAMQYNSSDTVYYKQARTIQEMATKKFQKLRIKLERSEKEVKSEQKEIKSEQKTKSNFSAKKQMKKPVNRTVHEPVGSDFSSGATLATAGDAQNVSAATQAGGCERPSNPADGPSEGNFALLDGNVERIEELSSGKGLLSKFGKKSSGVDDNRRATYNISNQPTDGSDSIFLTFESEVKQLVAVGLHAEYSYARSLARFAATLGPSAWKFASKRIEQALPPGYKFGRGWIGEYEPLPTPVLMLETRSPKEPIFLTRPQCPANEWKGDVTPRTSAPAKEPPVQRPTLEGKASLFHLINGSMVEGKPSLFPCGGTKPSSSMNPPYLLQNLPPGKISEYHNKASKQVELNLPPSGCQQDTDTIARKQLPKNSEMAAFNPREMPKTIGPVQFAPSKQPNGVVSGGLPNGKFTSSPVNSQMVSSSSNGVPNQMARAARNFTKGKDQGLTDPVEAMRVSAEKEAMRVSAEKESMRMSAEKEAMRVSAEKESMRVSAEKESMRVSVEKEAMRASVEKEAMRMSAENEAMRMSAEKEAMRMSAENEAMRMSAEKEAMRMSAEKEVMRMSAEKEAMRMSAEKEVMRMLAEKVQKQLQPSRQSSVDTPPLTPSVPSPRNDSNNAAAAAARAWMSIGAGGFRPPTENSVGPKSQISADSLYNPARQFCPQIPLVQGQFSFPAGMRLPSDGNFPFQAFMGQPVHVGNNEVQIQRSMAFPQFVAADLSRFQMQSPWRAPSPQQKQKQETLPPDLNIRFQPPGSPVKQSSGVMVDSPQPDLALQL